MSISLISSTPTAADALFSALSNRQAQMTALAQTALSTGADRAVQGDYAGAAQEFRLSIGLDSSPENAVKAYNLLATSYIQTGQTEDAIKAYKSSISMAPTDDAAHLNLGNIYFSQGRYSEAETEYKAAVRSNSTSSTNLFSLGQVYLATDNLQQAETVFTNVIKMNPDQHGGYYALGQTYAKEGRQQDAVAEFQKVVDLKKDFSDVHVDLGSAYADLGQMDKAQEELKILTDNAPDLVSLLDAYITKVNAPKLSAAFSTDGFNTTRGPGTKLSELGSSLESANASQQFNMTFLFSKQMDAASVTNPFNWSISRSPGGGPGGAYNWGLSNPATDTQISPIPINVVYLADSQSAQIVFKLNQNASADGTIDPSHITFKFMGKDVYGNAMDATADEYGGISLFV